MRRGLSALAKNTWVRVSTAKVSTNRSISRVRPAFSPKAWYRRVSAFCASARPWNNAALAASSKVKMKRNMFSPLPYIQNASWADR